VSKRVVSRGDDIAMACEQFCDIAEIIASAGKAMAVDDKRMRFL